jgi:hypothetical protein
LTPPYRGVRYHLKEWKHSNAKPQNKEELFNLRHASLRNVVERAFGIVKKRFSVLQNMGSFDLQIQNQIVYCCCMIHNYIRRNQGYEDDFDRVIVEEDDSDNDDNNNNNAEEGPANQGSSTTWRDGIAQAMWDEYMQYLLNNP